MESNFKAGLAAAALALSACLATTASATDLRGYRGSLKDSVPVRHTSAGPCYFRADVGYGVSGEPDINWPVVNGTSVNDTVTNIEIEGAWLGEVGVGCGSGSRGFRGEFVLGVRGEKKMDGEPPQFGVPDDPIHVAVTSYTAMFNVYKDLGRWHRVVPYIGAGIGIAYNTMDDVYFTQNPALVNRIRGNNDLAFAWSLMAGFAYQVSNRAILDFGYRYIDFGSVKSDRVDSGLNQNPAVEVEDLTAHEFKVGLRYHFGGSTPAHMAYK